MSTIYFTAQLGGVLGEVLTACIISCYNSNRYFEVNWSPLALHKETAMKRYGNDEFLPLITFFGLPRIDFEEAIGVWLDPKHGIEMVFLGGCARAEMNAGQWARGIVDRSEDVPVYEHFQEAFNHHGEPKVALLMSRCCGQYNATFISRLEERFPRVKWITPVVTDYGWRPDPDMVRKDLEENGIIAR